MMIVNSNGLVVIMLCTYNGEKHLGEQLDSILNQSYKKITILASDDGSSDNTVSILQKYQNIFGRENFLIFTGPKKGFVSNFLNLLSKCNIEAEYFAYSDQDDIWEKEKLSHAISLLNVKPKNKPALYLGRTCLINSDGKKIGFSPKFTKPPTFNNALVQSIAGGNTMVFNKASFLLLKKAGVVDVVSHDWWTYLLISGAGGNIMYDKSPMVLYRQHKSNLIGSNLGYLAVFSRIRSVMKSKFKLWNEMNIKALQNNLNLLENTNLSIFRHFCKIKDSNLIIRLLAIYKSGIYRQTMIENIALIFFVILKKV